MEKCSKLNLSNSGLVKIVATSLIVLSLSLSACDREKDITLEDRMNRATIQQSEGNLEASIIELKNAIRLFPENKDVRFMLGKVYLEAEDAYGAEKEFLKSQELGGDEKDVVVPLARAWLLLGRFDRVIDTVQIEANESSISKLNKKNLLAAAHMGMLEFDRADQYIDEILAVAPRNVNALVGKARLSFINQDNENVDVFIKRAEEILANDKKLLQLKGEILWKDQNYPQAENIFQQLVNRHPYSIDHKTSLAWLHVIMEKYDLAQDEIEVLQKQAPEYGMVNYVSGLLALKQKKYRDAKTYSEMILKYNSNDIRALYLAAISTFALGSYEQSYSHISRYLRFQPKDEKAHKLLAEMQFRMDKGGDAEQSLKMLSQRAEEKELYLNALARIEINKGNLEQARAYLEQSLREDSTQAHKKTQLAQVKIAMGDVDAGLEELEKALAGLGGNQTDKYVARLKLAMTLISVKKYDEAIAICVELQGLNADNPSGFLCEAIALSNQGDQNVAAAMFENILEKNNDNKLAGQFLLRHYMNKGALDKASSLQKKFVGLYPQDPNILYNLFVLEIRKGNQETALGVLKNTLKVSPTDSRANLAMALYHIDEGEYDKALSISKRINILYPETKKTYEIMGMAQLNLGNYSAAVLSFENLVKRTPGYMPALLQLSQAQYANRMFEALEETSHKILKLESDNPNAILSLARVAAEKKQWARANELVGKLSPEMLETSAVLALRGRISVNEGNLEKAIRLFEESFSKSRSNIYLLQLIKTYQMAGQKDKSVEIMQEWLRQNPQDYVIVANLGDSYLLSEQYDKAIVQYEVILSDYPDKDYILNNYAWALYKKGHIDRALSAIKKAREGNGNSAEILDTEAEILLAAGRIQDAIRQYRKAADMQPNSLIYKYRLAQALLQDGKNKEVVEILTTLKKDGRIFKGQMDAFSLLEKLLSEE